MSDITYIVTERHEAGGCDEVWRGTETTVAMVEAQLAVRNAVPGSRVFIEWHRPDDHQIGYLNPGGNHDIEGRAW